MKTATNNGPGSGTTTRATWLNFQVVPLARDYTDWLDSPILYLASHRAPQLSADDKRKLRAFVDAGGLLFTHADGDSAEFNQFAESLANTLFGDKYEMADLPPDHLLYSVVFKIDPPPRLRAVSNGSRILMLHAPTDLARTWQARDEVKGRELYEFGVNLFLYAAGKRDLRNRLDSPFVSESREAAPNGKVALARLTYAGNWDPEPAAFTRFARWMHRQTGTGVDVKPIPLSSLSASLVATFPIAHLTGTAKAAFNASDARALRTYVEAGGVVVIDPCGGPNAFHYAVGADLMAKPRVRPFAIESLKESGTGSIQTITLGKGHVILLPLDLTSGLLGTGTWGIAGYEPGYAQDLLKNVVFWTMDGQREK
jgi:hypothetical protein